MESYFNSNYKAPVKINIELTGPIKGLCDIPVGNANEERAVMPLDFFNEVITKAVQNDVLMYTFMLADHRDIFNDKVKNLFERLNVGPLRDEALKSLFFPLDKVDINRIQDLENKINEFIANYSIDALSFYAPLRYFETNKTPLTRMLIDINSKYFLTVKIFTDLPERTSEIQEILLPLIQYIVKTANLSDAFVMGFLMPVKSNLDYSDVVVELNNLCKNSDYIFILQPPIHPCLISKENLSTEVLLPNGYCPSGNIFITYTVDGRFVPCLKFRDKKLSDNIIDKWSKVENEILSELEECKFCRHIKNCSGLCQLYKDVKPFKFS